MTTWDYINLGIWTLAFIIVGCIIFKVPFPSFKSKNSK